MISRSWPSRFALWAAVCALLLKGAVPMFAATAAHLQGVPVADVCTVYGVSLASAKAQQGSHDEHAHHHHAPDHGKTEDHSGHKLAAHGDHCALTALASLAGPDDVDWAIAPVRHVVTTVRVHRTESAPDACALWVARLKHGPPAHA